MKNITVFPCLVIIFFILNFPFIYSDTNARNYSFTLSPHTGFIYGQALELLYQDPAINDSEFLSKLQYEMKPVVYFGLQLDFGKIDIMSTPGFFSILSFKIGIPGITGIHENRDWQSEHHSYLTDYARQTNRTHEFYSLDLSFGASIPLKSYAYVKPFVSGSWMRFSFSGHDGYGIYLNDPDDPASGTWIRSYSGKVITYKQDWFLCAFGFTIGTKLLYPFTFDFTFKTSPFTYCIALDEHLTTNATYKDYTNFGIYLEPSVSISYYPKNNLIFSFDFNYRYIGQTRGRGYRYYPSIPLYVPLSNDAGASLSLFDFRFLVKIIF